MISPCFIVVDFAIVESIPIFPGCKKSSVADYNLRRQEDLQCFNAGIMNHIKNEDVKSMGKVIHIVETVEGYDKEKWLVFRERWFQWNKECGMSRKNWIWNDFYYWLFKN